MNIEISSTSKHSLVLMQVYSETVEPIVPLIFNRTKATCFAYGQTGKISNSHEIVFGCGNHKMLRAY